MTKKRYYFLFFAIILFLLIIFFLFNQFDKINIKSSNLNNTSKSYDLFSHFFSKAIKDYEREEFNQVIESLKKLEDKDLSNKESYLLNILFANVLKKQGFYLSALEKINVATTFLKQPYAYLLAGTIHEQLNQNEQAEKSYFEALSQNNNYYQANEKLGDLYLKEGLYAKAVEEYEITNQKHDYQIPIIKTKISLTLYLLKEYQKSLQTLEKITTVERYRFLNFIYFLTALNYEKVGEFSQAAEVFQKAIGASLQQDKSFFLYHWASIRGNKEDYFSSIKLLKQALSNTSLSSEKYKQISIKLANVLILNENYQEAVDIYLEIMKKSPYNLQISYQLGVAFYKLGQYKQAISVLLQVKNSKLRNEVLLSTNLLLALSYEKLGDISKSQEILDNISDLWGGLPIVVYHLLKVKIKIDKEDFLINYQKYVKNHRDENLKLLLAKYFETIGDYKSALSILTEYEQIAQTAPSIKKKIGDLFVMFNEYEIAKQYYSEILLQEQGSSTFRSQVLSNLAYSSIYLNGVTQAEEHIKQAMFLHNRKVPFWYNLSLIKKAAGLINEQKEILAKALKYIDEENDKILKSKIYLEAALLSINDLRHREAERFLKKAYFLDPNNERIVYLRKTYQQEKALQNQRR